MARSGFVPSGSDLLSGLLAGAGRYMGLTLGLLCEESFFVCYFEPLQDVLVLEVIAI